MKCKKHPCDLSSSVGVCASCLRESLGALIVAQSQAQSSRAAAAAAAAAAAHSRAAAAPSSSSLALLEDEVRKSDPHPHHPPPPLLFPRSVSPYVSRRKSDDTSPWTHHHGHIRFYSTPQVGPTYNNNNNNNDANTFAISTSYKKRHSRFSFLSNFLLFRSRSHKPDSNPIDQYPPSSSPPRSSWFSNVFSYRKKKQSNRLHSVASTNNTRPIPSNRGMSPVRHADWDCDYDHSPSGSGRSSLSEESSKRTPMAAPPVPARRGRPAAGHVRSSSGLAFCLSPLVRASPNWHWNQKGGFPSDFGFSGEFRGVPAASKPHLSGAASFCANRSRKLADFGKVNHNR